VDVKLDRGGIRDIEFLVQCLQRVYGGEEQWLRPGGTLFSLQKLHDKGHLSGKDFHDLSLAYEFLRKVEHRLQLQHARQTHRLPPSPEDLRVLYRAVDSNAASENPAALLLAIQAHMASVTEIYERMVRRQKFIEKAETEAFRLTPPPERGLQDLSFQQVLQRIALDSPALHALVTREDLSVHASRNMHRFLSSTMTTAERYRSLIENPAAMRLAIALFATSDYLTGILLRHPGVLPALNHLPGPQEQLLFESHPEQAFAHLQAADTSEALSGLRSTYRRLIFSSAAKDVLHGREVEDALRENSRIADAAIGAALRISGGEDSLAVFALGRLGTMEFDIASDADLIFVRAPNTDAGKCRAIAEKLIHALAAYTKEGTVFAVDTRLRPRGNDGELVVTPMELDAYLKNEARPWEALTYAKLRPVAGAPEIAAHVLPQVWNRIAGMESGPEFTADCAYMRLKLEKSDRFPASLKLMPGGFYDIDFVTALLVLRSANPISETTVTRLRRLHQTGLLETSAEMQLRHAAIFYRSVDHAVRLVTGRAANALPAAEHAHQATAALVQRMWQGQSSETLKAELQRTAIQVRAVFNAVFLPKLPGATVQ
jgi:glutamate-ammonia-ligase adenylyltransferase